MGKVNNKASKGEINADQLEESRTQATDVFGVTFQKLSVFKGVIFLVWILSHIIINHKYQNDDTSDWTKICKWKYLNMVTPIPELPGVTATIVGGPQMDYHAYIDVLIFVPIFLIDFMIGKYLKDSARKATKGKVNVDDRQHLIDNFKTPEGQNNMR